VTNKALKVEVGDEQRAFVGYGSFESTIDNLENALRPGPYICGEQFTAADLYLGSQIGFGMMFGSIEKRPIFEEYFGRLSARPAAIRAYQIDEGLIAEQKAQAPQPQPA
jgi:glutathione S-transferase